MKELTDYLREVILPILDHMPAPKLGEWNWPQIAKILRENIAKAEGEHPK